MKRPVLFSVNTPVPDFGTVTCFEDSWSFHIADKHPEVADKLPEIQQVISDPTHVFVFTDRAPSNVVFFDGATVNAENKPLFVLVNRDNLDVRSAYFKDDWKDFKPAMMSRHKIIWRKS